MQLASGGVTLEPNTQEQHVLGRLRELREAGYTSQAVAAELNRQGYRSRTGVANTEHKEHPPVSHGAAPQDGKDLLH